MSCEREKVRLADICELITKGTTPTTIGYGFTDSGINFVKSESVTFDGWIDKSKFAFIDLETHEALKRSQLHEFDLLFSMAGVFIGKTAVVPNSILPANTNQAVGIIRLKTSRAVPRYIDYYLRNPSYNRFLNNLVSQSAQPNLNLTEIRNLPIVLPPLPEQKAIASILGALDDKIELNRRMNATLEAMARALFQSWFVDFDPVRAKAAGRKPAGMNAETAALFPNSFQDSELGNIPKGWKITQWGNIASLEYGKSLRDYRQAGGTYRVFGTNGPIGYHDQALCGTEGIVIGRKGAYRGVHYSPQPFFVIDTAFYLKPIIPIDLKWAYYELLQFDINSMDSGSAIPSTSRDDFYGIRVSLPPIRVQLAFGEIVDDLFAKTYANERQSFTLATLRDALLPKLLSGELSTVDASRKMEVA